MKSDFILIVLISIFVLNGCTKTDEKTIKAPQYAIGVVTKSRDSEYWMSVCSGMEKAAADLNVSVLILSPDTETDDKMQKKMIDDLMKKGIDALAISPIDSYSSKEYINFAIENGISVFSYDTQIVDSDIPYIGIDNKKAGYELAKYMSEKLNSVGKVGIISGNLNQVAHSDRIAGFKDYIQNYTDIEIAFVESGYSNLQMSENEITRLMNENLEISGILATSAVTALGIMEYMKNQPVIIATVDAQKDAIEAVKNGRIAALACQSGYDIGYETIKYIVDFKAGVQQPKQKILDIGILTTDTD